MHLTLFDIKAAITKYLLHAGRQGTLTPPWLNQVMLQDRNCNRKRKQNKKMILYPRMETRLD